MSIVKTATIYLIMLHKKSMLGFIRDLNLVYRNYDSHEQRVEGENHGKGLSVSISLLYMKMY